MPKPITQSREQLYEDATGPHGGQSSSDEPYSGCPQKMGPMTIMEGQHPENHYSKNHIRTPRHSRKRKAKHTL